MKVRPAQVSTIAFTCGSLPTCLIAVHDAETYGGAERVHRRAVDRDNGDFIGTFHLHNFTHAALSLSLCVTVRSFGICPIFAHADVDFALRNLISQLDTEGYFEERPLSTRNGAT